MAEVKRQQKTARDLAEELSGTVEALANIRYLIDRDLCKREELVRLRLLETQLFQDVLHRLRRVMLAGIEGSAAVDRQAPQMPAVVRRLAS